MEQEVDPTPTVMLFRGGPWDGGAFYLENTALPDALWVRLRMGLFGDGPCDREWVCVPSLCFTESAQGRVGPYRRQPEPLPTKRRMGVKFANGQALFRSMAEVVYLWEPLRPGHTQPV